MSTSAPVTFASMGLSAPLLQALEKEGLKEPTPIQAKAIPAGLEGRDVLGCAQTGTGKTAAFVIPMIERLAGAPRGLPRGLVLAPTRELAFQIQGTVDKLGRCRKIFSTPIVGGSDMQAQIRGLRQQPDIIVSTPGRLLDHMWNGTVKLTDLQIVVLDEADRMLDMGFAPQLNQILDAIPEQRQTLLFSATIPSNLADLARVSVKDPVRAMVSKSATPADGVSHSLHHTTPDGKVSLLLSILKEQSESVLVFTRTKHRANRIGETLERAGHRVGILHGGRRLSQRRMALEGFRTGRYRILVATDIAARGLDVANIAHVINFDIPNVPEDYVHRIGRTARMNALGRATSFVTGEDYRQVRAIEKLLGYAVPHVPGSPQHSRPRAGAPVGTLPRARPTQGPRHIDQAESFQPRRRREGTRPAPSRR